MTPFKEWYTRKHGAYPGEPEEFVGDIFQRLADAFAEYVDEAMKQTEADK